MVSLYLGHPGPGIITWFNYHFELLGGKYLYIVKYWDICVTFSVLGLNCHCEILGSKFPNIITTSPVTGTWLKYHFNTPKRKYSYIVNTSPLELRYGLIATVISWEISIFYWRTFNTQILHVRYGLFTSVNSWIGNIPISVAPLFGTRACLIANVKSSKVESGHPSL